jgi:PadR family transcriptional regulator, regulatory protein PadR
MKSDDIGFPEPADDGSPVDIQALGRGIHEVLILAVLRGGPGHGYQIALDVEDRTGGVFVFQHGTLYPILHRLEKAGRITGSWDPVEGRRRKIYKLTPAGRRHLELEGGRIEAAFRVLHRVLGGET